MDNMMPYLTVTNEKDIIDLDTLQRIRRVSECSIGGTSGYNSTDNSPNPYSPVLQNSPQYLQLQNVQHMNANTNIVDQSMYYHPNMNFSPHLNFGNSINYQLPASKVAPAMPYKEIKNKHEASLRITIQPVEKFRFRYKSEMHGTHGSLNGTNSKRNVKTFPEVELCGYNGPAIIRCSLFQSNLESPHSHQLVVRKEDHDICDPHELKVSKEVGYFAEFKNMGIIHTAKKFIIEELLKKKRHRLGRDYFTTKEEQELHKQTEKEAKDMNLNQVRLCFEAFRIEENNSYTPISAPVYSNPINNRKSAQTGELRIVRLSIATGNVNGGDDLMLLVEKVSKKNIKVRFYEMDKDEQVWEAYAHFRESDVHHQYAIVCRTPPYKNKNIDEAVEVFIELVRPSDDERSCSPVSFRYKPNPAISRKRRRTCSSLNSGSFSNSGSLSSGDIPKTVQEQQNSMNIECPSNEINYLLKCTDLCTSDIPFDSDLLKMFDNCDEALNVTEVELGDNGIEKDGVFMGSDGKQSQFHFKKHMISKKQLDAGKKTLSPNLFLQRIISIFQDTIRSPTPLNPTRRESAAEQVAKIINEHSEKYPDPLIHEIVITNNYKLAIPIFKILEYFKLNKILNKVLNKNTQTALHYACLYSQPNYIRPLLKLGCDANIQDIDGNTALHIAVAEKNLKCLESFINSDMDLNLNHLNYDGFTPLHLGIRDNNYDIVEKLLKFDASTVVTASGKDGTNALHMAVQQQNLKMVNLILNTPLIVNALHTTNRAGYTPLDLAKQVVSSDEQGNQILSALLSYYNKYSSSGKIQKMEEDDDEVHDVIIKEEYSSTEDDEDDNYSGFSKNEPILSTSQNIILEEIEIKTEESEDITNDIINIKDLEMALNDKDIVSKICVKLNENDKWKKLAKDMNVPVFYLTNAEAFLNSLKRNFKSICYQKLTLGLKAIDDELIQIIKQDN